jgi:hypothetical protein
MNGRDAADWHDRTLRGWQLAVLRFAVTLDTADGSNVQAIAQELDRLGTHGTATLDFSFFRKTSAALCTAILNPGERSTAVLRRYVMEIGDNRLRRAFAATMEIDLPQPRPANKPSRSELWRGLPPRRASA